MTEDVEKPKLKRRKDSMTIRELLEELGIHPEDSGREMIQYLLEQRGYKCVAERLRLDPDYDAAEEVLRLTAPIRVLAKAVGYAIARRLGVEVDEERAVALGLQWLNTPKRWRRAVA